MNELRRSLVVAVMVYGGLSLVGCGSNNSSPDDAGSGGGSSEGGATGLGGSSPGGASGSTASRASRSASPGKAILGIGGIASAPSR